jgi:hypothetical protein
VSLLSGHFTPHRLLLGTASLATVGTFLAACGAAPSSDARPSSAHTAAINGTGRAATLATPASPAARATPAASPSPSSGLAALLAGTTVPGAPNCPAFPSNNVWNTNISKLPVDSHSAAWLASMDSASTYLHPDFGPDPGGYPYGIPFAIVTNETPTVHVTFQYASESYQGAYPFGPDTPIEGGQDSSGDRHAIMVNSDTCTLYELWDAHYSAGGSTAGSGAMWHLRSNALRPAGWTSADAAGLPILPGLLDYAQVKAAVRSGKPITHAIRFTADLTQAAYLWPARHFASTDTSADVPPMGARFRLKASFDVATFCANSQPYCRDAKVVLVEMQDYGLILADNGSNWYFQGSAYPQWPDALVTLLKGIPASAFQAVNEACLMVSGNSGLAKAGPGCPIG